MKRNGTIRAWHIGEEGEVFAGRCDEKGIKRYYKKLLGNRDEANKRIASCFVEIPQSELDEIRNWNIDGDTVLSSYRKEAEKCVELPMQIATTYN